MYQHTCIQCGESFEAKRSDAKACSKLCSRRHYYARNRETENARFRAAYAADPEHYRARRKAYGEERWGEERRARADARAALDASPDKACTRCGMVRLKSEFHRDPRRRAGLHSWCKPCFHAYVNGCRTPEENRERARRAYADPVKREAMKARHREWTKANREKGRQYNAKRRARMLETMTEDVDFETILELHGLWCHICERDIADLDDMHFDHVVPLAKNGTHTWDNIRPAHATCNLVKKDRVMDEGAAWLISLRATSLPSSEPVSLTA